MAPIESHMAMNLASDSVSLSKTFSCHKRVENFQLSLDRGLEIQLGLHVRFVKPSLDILMSFFFSGQILEIAPIFVKLQHSGF